MRKTSRLFFRVFFLVCLSVFFSTQNAGAGVVLVLSGGGTRGFAHIGVIEVLEEHGIPVVGIVGTSIGALIGALNASGYDSEGLRHIISNLDLPALLSENTGPMFVFTGDDHNAKMNTISALTYKKSGKHGGPLGILTGDKLFQYFISLIKHVDVTDFNELPIPFAAIASDIQTGEKVVLRSGSLPSAMRASMSIPAFFEPWNIDGRILVDGGLVSNLPIETAKELFPGFPVIGVDVSDAPTGNRPINSFIDVVDQSLTILMRRATVEESLLADLVITPNVHEFSFLDSSAANEIIERGREVALANVEKIKSLSAGAPDFVLAQRTPSRPAVIQDVRIQGLPDKVAIQMRRKLLGWVNKPFDNDEVERAAGDMMANPDIASVEYRLERTGDEQAILVLDVRRLSALEIGLSGYATNLNPYSWLYLKGTARGVFSDLDSIRGVIRVGDQWGFDVSYLTAPEPLSSWEFKLGAQKWALNTTDGNREWDRYSLGGHYLFRVGDVRMGAGAAYERIEGAGGNDSIGPTFFAHYDTLDIPADPTSGHAWRFNAWWPDLDEILYRVTYFKPLRVGNMWRTYLRLGYAEGNMNSNGHAAYLGAAEELYSVSNSPIEAERMVWANIAFRRILKRSVWGIVATEVFGGYGYAMDGDYEKIAAPWEVGVAINIPNNLVNVKLAAMYGSEEFKIGFFLGVPIWDHYPLP
ncbi:MAG: patatin-like phospholipase family protein [Synergistaceae bacterium]|nr:patatin-like phospholipase family protein [Synergistaceae bacterium]